jgi:hypothetical protein
VILPVGLRKLQGRDTDKDCEGFKVVILIRPGTAKASTMTTISLSKRGQIVGYSLLRGDQRMTLREISDLTKV